MGFTNGNQPIMRGRAPSAGTISFIGACTNMPAVFVSLRPIPAITALNLSAYDWRNNTTLTIDAICFSQRQRWSKNDQIAGVLFSRLRPV